MKKKTKAPFAQRHPRLHMLSSQKTQIRKHRPTFALYLVLRVLVIGILIRAAFSGKWETVFTCVLTLVLFFLPLFVEKTFRIKLPTVLECIAISFVFCAEILGEIACFYVKFAFWDTMLHTINGFMFAAFGFCLVDLFNRNERFSIKLSPVFLALMAFCFSMTIGVLWEFFEFSMDHLLLKDMQKDTMVQLISSVALDPAQENHPVVIRDIARTVLYGADGQVLTVLEGGYLDVGLADTMKDLFVNFIGATVFSIIGGFYVKHRGKGVIASQFIPVVVLSDPVGETVQALPPADGGTDPMRKM